MEGIKIIAAMRGRNPDNPTSRESGLPTEQRLEVNNQGVSNCITTVEKDNLVLSIDEQNMTCKCDVFGTITTDGSSPKHNNRVAEIQIRQATKDGSIPYEIFRGIRWEFP